MKDQDKTKEQLICELKELRHLISEFKVKEKEHKHDEEALRESKEKYSLLFDNPGVAIIFFGTEGKCVLVNRLGIKYMGLKTKDFIGKSIYELFPETADFHMKRFKKIMKEGKGDTFEDPFDLTKGKTWFSSNIQPVKDKNGNVLGIQIVSTDITERKKAEEALKESEEKFRTFMETASDLIQITDKDGYITYVNPSMAETLGYSKEEMIGMHITQILSEEIKNEFKPKLEELITKGEFRGEPTWVTKDGKEIHGETRVVAVYDNNGNSVGSRGIFRDITERKKAEQLQASLYNISEAAYSTENLEELYRSIYETIMELMPAKNFYLSLYDEDSEMLNFPYFVDEYEGNPGPQKLKKGLTEYVLRTEKPLLASPKVFKELEKKGEVKSVGPPSIDWLGIPLKVENKTIGVLTVQSYTEGVRYSEKDKNVLTFISEQVAMAIERKKAEEILQESEERYRELANSITDIFFAMDKDLRYTFWNKASEELTGVSAKDAIGKSLYELFSDTPQTHRAENEYSKVLRTQQPQSFVTDYHIKGEDFFFEINAYPTKDGISVFTKDITERKKAEEKIKASLKEKEVMLEEIHHRVKNNMQIISSLLRLQSRKIKNKKMIEIFNESQNRIRSMAFIHEKLYQSKDFARINFAQYIQSFASHLFQIYRVNPNIVRLKTDTKDVSLNLNTAIPCGLILNELLSNSLKHAFPGNKKGEISIKLYPNKQGKNIFVVSDSGVGFPEELDFHKVETLGLQLVRDLVEQIEGTIKLDRKDGAKFRIVF